MKLTKEEQLMLSGGAGVGVQKAMEVLVALGEIYGAVDMVEIKSSQISGVSYKNIGEAGLMFLKDWASTGVRVQVPSTLNPSGVDVINWRDLGFSQEFALKQKQVLDAYASMGVTPTCTCTPYLAGNIPCYGDHLAWSESSAVVYANSVLGARTNREGGPSALAAAIAGRTPRYGLHLEANRKASLVVDVCCELVDYCDYGALGFIVGHMAGTRVPYLYLRKNKDVGKDSLKTLGAAMAASGSVALYHIHKNTPEALRKNMVSEDAERVAVEDLEEGYSALDSDADEIDFVAVGCPHASVKELKEAASMLEGLKIKKPFWITTSRKVRDEAASFVKVIEASGAKVVSDTCMIVAPVEELGFKTMATNSGKAAFYAPKYCNLKVRYGPLDKCVRAALTGRWF